MGVAGVVCWWAELKMREDELAGDGGSRACVSVGVA
jgi:hypothetical protein